MKKISKRFNWLLIFSICISVIFSSLLTTGLMIARSLNEIHERNLIQVQSLTDNLESFFANAFCLNHQLSINPVVINNVDRAEEDWTDRTELYRESYGSDEGSVGGMFLLESNSEMYSWVELFFVQDMKGRQTARSSGMIGERGDRWWFKEFTEDPEKRPFLSKSYYSMTGNKPVASVFHPVYNGSEVIGIIGTDINFTILQEMVSGYLYSEDLEAVVIDPTGTVIAHPEEIYMRELYNLPAKTKNVLKTAPDGSIIQDESGHHMTETVDADIEDELSLAASELLEGMSGFIKNTLLDGNMCSVYYQPAYFPGARVEEAYGVILIYNHNRMIVFTRLLIGGIFLFIVGATALLFLIFKYLFNERILSPLSVLIDAMEDRDIDNFRMVELETGDEFELLAGSYNSLRVNLAETHEELQARMEELAVSEEGYRTFAGIGVAMSGETEKMAVLKLIIRKGMEFCNAEGGTLYLHDPENRELNFEIIYNDILDIQSLRYGEEQLFNPVPLYIDEKPNNTNVSSFCAISGEIVNIPDVYNADGFDFEGMKKYDRQNGYKSKSMLVIPLKNLEGDIVGVLQLINAREDCKKDVTAFSEHHKNLVTVLASQGAVTLTNIQLNKNLEEFIYSFIRSIATAVDEKSHYTSGHIERVVTLSSMIVEKINEDNNVFRDVTFQEDEIEEIRVAAWMHDVGKISIPEDVLDKSTKLMFSRDNFELIKTRADLIASNWEIEILRKFVSKAAENSAEESEYRELEKRIAGLKDDLQLLNRMNRSGEFMNEKNLIELIRIGKTSAASPDRKDIINLLTDDEKRFLSIRHGTLDANERKIIESHVGVTRKILDNLQFPGHLSRVPLFASQHHEKLDGSGYDQGINGGNIPLQSRIIAVSDVFEALTSRDRPYRKPLSFRKVINIMNQMCENRHIDCDIFNLMMEKDIVSEYCKSMGISMKED